MFVGPLISIFADLAVGQTYRINLADVDGNTFSTADGRAITVLVLTTSNDPSKAQLVGDRIPDFCLSNPAYRMVTVLNFQKKRLATTRVVLRALIRRRLDSEAQRLQSRYREKGISRDARKDVFAVPDFDGSIVAQLGLPFSEATLRVYVFGKKGELLRKWNDVPRAQELAAALK
jgi:hypothetical protein